MTETQASEEGVRGAISPPKPIAEDPLLADLSCDPTVMEREAREGRTLLELPSDPWLRRRAHHFGASEVAALLVALGRRPADAFGSIVAKQSKRLLHRKARLAKPLAMTDVMRRGIDLEPKLIAQWQRELRAGTQGGYAPLIDPDSVHYVEGLPPVLRCLSPVVDHECPELAASLDVLCLDVFGHLVAVDGKCSFRAYEATKPRHVVQLNSQMACSGAEAGVIVEGVRWANPYFDAQPDTQPIRTHEVVERNEALIEEIRDACREGMARVREMQREAA